MAISEHINKLKEGYSSWNLWRKSNKDLNPDLCDIDFNSEFNLNNNNYNLPTFENVDFTNCNLRRVSLRNCIFIECVFDNSDIHFSDLVNASFHSCSFKNVGMRVCKIGSAEFIGCSFINSDLSYSSAEDTCFIGSVFNSTILEHISFINNDFSNTTIDKCYVYGISSWDLNTNNSVHSDLIITKGGQPTITVDNLELAQFIYMMINHKRLREIIYTITSKVVLILGNFSPKRKKILDDIRFKLREHDFIPVLFDFDKPSTRNLTETVFTLAHLSKFVIADLSSPRCIPHELSTIIPRLPSVNIYPIINSSEKEYGMFSDYENYKWVKPVIKYDNEKHTDVVKSIMKEEKK